MSIGGSVSLGGNLNLSGMQFVYYSQSDPAAAADTCTGLDMSWGSAWK
jgi:hypothetical protein